MNKRLRFIVADMQHATCVHIEKLLNSLGQFSIVPVSTFKDVAVLSHCGDKMFDGLIINAALLPKDMLQIFSVGRVGATLVYDHKGVCSLESPQVFLSGCSIPERDLLSRWFEL